MTERSTRSMGTAAPGLRTPRTPDLRSVVLGLAERFLPHEATGLDACWVLEVDGGDVYTVHVHDGQCLISPGAARHADAVMVADADTWRGILDSSTEGPRAFLEGRLAVSGDLNLALRLETLFRPGPEARRVTRTLSTTVHGVRLESLVSGAGTPVVLLHGLGASKVSFLPTFDSLADHFEVHALDLPGFGKSDRPLPTGRRYTPRWMADIVNGYLVQNQLRGAYVVGNSMGGRIATELALRHPRHVLGAVGLGSAVAFDEWRWASPALRLLRGQWLGLAPVPKRREWIESTLRDLFHDPGTIPADNFRAAAEEFLRDLTDRRYRLATLACARHLVSDRARGRGNFWDRLGGLRVPSYWVWGRSDRLVSHRYAQRVQQVAPDARVEVWDAVGHVPQFEAPARTNAAVADFVRGVEGGRD